TQIMLGVLRRAFSHCQPKIQVRLKYVWFRFHGLLVCRNRIFSTSEGMIDITQVVPGGVLLGISLDDLLQQRLRGRVIVLCDGIFRLGELGKSRVFFLHPMMPHCHVLRLAGGGGRLAYAPLPDSDSTGDDRPEPAMFDEPNPQTRKELRNPASPLEAALFRHNFKLPGYCRSLSGHAKPRSHSTRLPGTDRYRIPESRQSSRAGPPRLHTPRDHRLQVQDR